MKVKNDITLKVKRDGRDSIRRSRLKKAREAEKEVSLLETPQKGSLVEGGCRVYVLKE